MELPYLDAKEILRDRSRWKPLARSEAVHACRTHPVAVVGRVQSREAASWLDPANRLFRSDGPYLYEGLRYFLFTGAFSKGLSGSNPAPKAEPEELEPLEALDMSGEEQAVEEKPEKKHPIEFKLVDGAGKALVGAEYEVTLGPKIPALPDIPDVPDLPILPGLPDLPDIPAVPRPVEILLIDEKDKPLPNASFSVQFPDGKVATGKSDAAGSIRFPDNTQEGELILTLTEFQAGAAS